MTSGITILNNKEEYLLLKFYRFVYTISPATNRGTN